MKQSHIGILSTFVIFLLLIIEYLFADNTYSLSIDISKYLQSHDGIVYETLGSIILFFSFAGDRLFTNYLIIFLWIKCGKKEQILKIITIYCFTTFLGDILKMIYSDPRPFYLNDTLIIDICQLGYGNPSGHSLRTLVFYIILSDTLIFKRYCISENNLGVLSAMNRDYQSPFDDHLVDKQILYDQLYPNSMISYNQYKIMLGIFIALIGLSRLYLGVHFIDQIVVGWLVGGYILILYYYAGFEQILENIISNAIVKRQNLFRQNLKIILIYLFFILISLLIYFYNINSTQIAENKVQWNNKITKYSNCNSKDYYEDYDLLATTILSLPLYLYLNCLFTYGQYRPQDYQKSICTLKNFGRILVLLSVIGINILAKQILKQFNLPLFLRFLIIGQLYYFGIAICIIRLIPVIYKWMKLDQEGDLFRRITEIEQQELEL